jgi:hypothetical protein
VCGIGSWALSNFVLPSAAVVFQDVSAARAYSEEVREGLTFVFGTHISTANVIMRGLIEDIQ